MASTEHAAQAMHQVSFVEAECRDKFLEQMESLVPWQRLEAKIEPFYLKAGTWCWQMSNPDGYY